MWKWISKITVVAVTLILMVLTCEVATRIFARLPVDVSQRDPLIGRRYEPNLARHIYNYEIDEPVFLKTNQLGFRGDAVSVEKPDNIRRIAVLGDSYTASMALADEQTFCGRLEHLLNSKTSSDDQSEVLNFGISGSGTGQELALYRHLVKDLKPDVVVVAFGNATDVRDNSRELSKNPIIQFDLGEDGKLFQIPQSQGRVRASNVLNRISHFYTWQKLKANTIKRLIQANAELVRGRHLIYARQEPEAYTRAWTITAEILRVLRDECREEDTDLMIVALPSAYQVYPEYFRALQTPENMYADLDSGHPDHRLEDICDRLGIRFHTLTPAFIEQAPSGSHQIESEQLFIGGVNHFNARGSQVAATNIASWISASQVAGMPGEYD